MKSKQKYVWYCSELNMLNITFEKDPHFLCKNKEGIYLLLYIPFDNKTYSFYLVGKL